MSKSTFPRKVTVSAGGAVPTAINTDNIQRQNAGAGISHFLQAALNQWVVFVVPAALTSNYSRKARSDQVDLVLVAQYGHFDSQSPES